MLQTTFCMIAVGCGRDTAISKAPRMHSSTVGPVAVAVSTATKQPNTGLLNYQTTWSLGGPQRTMRANLAGTPSPSKRTLLQATKPSPHPIKHHKALWNKITAPTYLNPLQKP